MKQSSRSVLRVCLSYTAPVSVYWLQDRELSARPPARTRCSYSICRPALRLLFVVRLGVFCVVCERESVCVELRLHPALGTSKEFCPRFSTRAFFRQTSDWQPAKQQVAPSYEQATIKGTPDLGWGDRWDDQARDRVSMCIAS